MKPCRWSALAGGTLTAGLCLPASLGEIVHAICAGVERFMLFADAIAVRSIRSESARSDQDDHGLRVWHNLRILLPVEIDVNFAERSLDRQRVRGRMLEIAHQEPRARKVQRRRRLLHARIETGRRQRIAD